MAFDEILTDPSSSEMDTKGSSVEIGLSRASLKKYSGPARRRAEARAAAIAAQRANEALRAQSMMGLDLNPVKAIKKAAKTIKKTNFKKLDLKKVNKLVKTVGPIAAVAFPAAAPAIGTAMVVLNAAEKGDTKAIAKVAATKALAESGNPEAQQALDLYKTANSMKKNVKATELIKAAQGGNPQAKAKIEAIKAARSSNPEAALSFVRLAEAAKGIKDGPKIKAAIEKKQKQEAANPKPACECE